MIAEPNERRPLLAAVLCVMAAILGGCAFAPVAALSVAGGAAPVVYEYESANQADSYWIARYDDVVAAALRAGEKLSLDITEKRVEADRATLLFADERGDEISLRIKRRTETVTQVHFSFGARELSGFAGLLGRQTIDELKAADAFVVKWSNLKDSE